MSELTDLLLSVSDPVTAMLMLVVVGYLRQIKIQLQKEMARIRERTQRLEDKHIERADGGLEHD